MPKSAFVDFKAVKAVLSIKQVLGHYKLLGQFKKSGDSLSGPCPIHKGSNPTQFRVSLSKNVWNCFSECKHGGNALDFIARMENVSIHAAALKAIEWFRIDPGSVSGKSGGNPEAAEESPEPAQAAPAKTGNRKPEPVQEKSAPNKPLQFRLDKLERDHPYLVERGLTLETVIDFGIGYCAKGMMASRIAIPIHNPAGQAVAYYAGRYPGEPATDTPKYKLPQGFRKSLELFNIDRAAKEPAESPLVLVEGFFDCMKLHQHGFKKVVALMGSTLSGPQEDLIREHTRSNARIVVMLDEDEAGRAGREDIAVRLAKFAFVKIHVFAGEGQQPENLGPGELAAILS